MLYFIWWSISRFAVIVAISFLLCIIGKYALERPTCYAEWKNSGMHYYWSLSTGCLVEVDIGKWIPTENYMYKSK